jgi:non-homologous end joining protein Ku
MRWFRVSSLILRDTPYYLAPEDKVGQEAFAVIRDAMKKKKMVGIAALGDWRGASAS